MGRTILTHDDLSARMIADAVNRGDLPAAEAVERSLSRLADVNRRLNAVVAERPNGAREDAARLDQELTARPAVPGPAVGAPTPLPLAGVPFTVKDIISTSQLPTTGGSRVLRDYHPAQDATAVARLRDAGAILIGKSNCPEFAFSIDTSNELFGRTTNPLGDFTPGGSSGGEAAALAAGISALGLGSDFGGSIRWPAQCAGIVGLRPTVGRVPTTGVVPALFDGAPPNIDSFQGRIQVVGPMARTIGDLELALSVISGPDGIDGLAVDAPLPPATDIPLTNLEARYGYGIEDHASVNPDVRSAVDAAVATLRRSGLTLHEGLPEELTDAAPLYSRLRAMDSHAEIARVSRGRESELMPFTRQLLENARRRPRISVDELWIERNVLRERLLGWLRGDRVLILPVSSRPPLSTADSLALSGTAQFDVLLPSRAVSLFGLPSLSVPCTKTADGRPVSVQIVAPPFREDLAFAVGARLEQAAIAGA